MSYFENVDLIDIVKNIYMRNIMNMKEQSIVFQKEKVIPNLIFADNMTIQKQ